MISAYCLEQFLLFPVALLYSRLCWSCRRWTGQVWEVRINTPLWSPILHTYNRVATADNVEEAVKADDSTTKIVQATHILFSSQGSLTHRMQTQGRKPLKCLCVSAPLHTHYQTCNQFYQSFFLAILIGFCCLLYTSCNEKLTFKNFLKPLLTIIQTIITYTISNHHQHFLLFFRATLMYSITVGRPLSTTNHQWACLHVQ